MPNIIISSVLKVGFLKAFNRDPLSQFKESNNYYTHDFSLIIISLTNPLPLLFPSLNDPVLWNFVKFLGSIIHCLEFCSGNFRSKVVAKWKERLRFDPKVCGSNLYLDQYWFIFIFAVIVRQKKLSLIIFKSLSSRHAITGNPPIHAW